VWHWLCTECGAINSYGSFYDVIWEVFRNGCVECKCEDSIVWEEDYEE
jgi:hypothetical protein